MTSNQKDMFSSLKQSTSFKRELNNLKISGIGFSELNAHLLDAFLVNQYKTVNAFKYGVVKLLWVISKLVNGKLKRTNHRILFVPAELDKERSIGLYTPIYSHLSKNQYDLQSVNQVFNYISLAAFFKWVIKIPKLLLDVSKVINNDKSTVFKEIKWVLIIDSIFHYLWIIQLRKFFKSSGYQSVVVDWDRHKLQSLVVLAARLEGIETFTFVHGAIYTPEKFVPLIANRCFIWGNSHLEFFMNLGEEKGKLITVGNTRFNKALPERTAVLNKYAISAEKKIILHPSQNFPDLEDHVIIKKLHAFVSANKHFRLAVKFHPSQNNTALLAELDGLTDLILLDQSISALEALSIAEFTIIVSSTFAIDALITGVPVAIYKPAIELRGIAIDLVENANAPVLQSDNDFSSLLNDVLVKPLNNCFDMEAQQNFIGDYCEYYGDESAKLISGVLIK